MKSVRRQRGAILIMTAVIIIVLIGVAALAMDIGRLVVLRSQLQNAADAAAIAAAMELDGEDGARERAMAAAREAVKHDTSFAKLQDLLGPESLPDTAFTFYCIIGAEFDPTDNFSTYCNGTDDGSGRYESVTDPETHYVRITLDPALASGRFTLDLIFLPILNLITPGTATEASVSARAVAGRNFLECDYPPLAICDPFEGKGITFREAVPEGTSVQLKQQGSNQWSSGNFGFLVPITGDSGANAVSKYLANEKSQGCATRRIETEPGGMTNKTTAAVNTRFDMYSNGFNYADKDDDGNTAYPPAPNIIDYPIDSGLHASLLADGRFGNAMWDVEGYLAANPHPAEVPAGWSNLTPPSRWEVYKWEVNEDGTSRVPAAGELTSGHAAGLKERRLITVAVVSCNAAGLTGGKKSAVIFSPDGFAKFFLIKRATGPSDPEKSTIYGEYVGWAAEGDSNYHVEVKLYE